MSLLKKIELASAAGLLLKQQLEVLKNMQTRIQEDEAALVKMMSSKDGQRHILSIPGIGPQGPNIKGSIAARNEPENAPLVEQARLSL
jgi:transposase